MTEAMTKQEQERFDRQLDASDPARVSYGTQALLGLMSGGPAVGMARRAPAGGGR